MPSRNFNLRAAGHGMVVALALCGTAGLGGSGAALGQAVSNTELILKDVSVVDTRTGKMLPGMNVVIVDGKIAKISHDKVSARASQLVIEGKGKYLVPGFWEMHGHPIDSPDRVENLTLMLANGITGVRQMSGSDALLAERRAGTLMPATDAPELLAMPGAILLRGNAGTIPQAVAEVDKQKAEGADFIKTIEVPGPVFFAALKETHKLGLLYDGHLSSGVDSVEASEAGMDAMEHLGPQESILLSCSTDEDAIRQAMAQRAQAGPPPMAAALTTLTKAATTNPTLLRAITDPASFQRLQHILDTYSEEKCRGVAKVFVAHHTWQVPTLIRLRTAEFGDDPAYSEDPYLIYVGDSTRQLWKDVMSQFSAKVTPENKATLKQFYSTQARLAKLFSDEGVAMLAGSDFGGMWLVAGYSLHQEFDQLHEAGLAPLKVLQMTTLDAAHFLGRDETDGNVTVGKNANLVLLDGNPLESVANLHRINGVVRGGKYYSTGALSALKKKVQDDVAAARNTPAAKTTP